MRQKIFTATVFLFLLNTGACTSAGQKKESSSKQSGVDLATLCIEIQGWEKDGEAVTCHGLDELINAINGGAPFYTDRGVTTVVFQDYATLENASLIKLEIYQLSEETQAATLYKDVYVEEPEILTDIGKQARLAPKLIGTYSVDFHKGDIYVRVTITAKDETAKATIIKVASDIAAKI